MASRKKSPSKQTSTKKAAPKKSAKSAKSAKKPAKAKAKAKSKTKPKKAAAAKSKKAAAKPKKAAKAAKAAKTKSKKAAKAVKAKPKKVAKPAAKPKKAVAVPRSNDGAEPARARQPPRRTRETTLPPGHELLDQGPIKGDPVQKELVIEAVRAALQAVEQHPIKGAPVLERRNLVDLPKEGEIDFAIAQEAQKSARELLDADATVRAEQRQVDERIAEVYESEAQTDDLEAEDED